MPPNVRGRGPLLDGPGLGVALVAIVKDEADYLDEWLCYHLALGVDHFFIYDNGSTDGSAELLERYISHGWVTRIDWPIKGGQVAAYNHALRMFGTTATWLGFYDPDEFLVPLQDVSIPQLLARFPDAAVLRIPRVEIGFSGHRIRPQGLAIESYDQVANVLDLDPALPPRVKSIVRPGSVSAVDVHLGISADVLPPGAPAKTYERELDALAQLSHFYTRSWEEFEAKRFHGSATGRIARPAVDLDLPTIAINDAAARYADRTRAMMARVGRLDPEPYMYGSQIGFEYFPRPNDLFRFGEFAVANYAAGLEEPKRYAAIRLRNRYRGVGLVADISEAEVEPARDAFSTSPHAEALVAHMRGRIVTGLSLDPGGTISARSGRLSLAPDAPAELDLADGVADVILTLPPENTDRCYTLALLAAADAPVAARSHVIRADGSRSAPVRFELPAGSAVAALIEIEPDPVAASELKLHLESEAGRVRLFDLFAIAYG